MGIKEGFVLEGENIIYPKESTQNQPRTNTDKIHSNDNSSSSGEEIEEQKDKQNIAAFQERGRSKHYIQSEVKTSVDQFILKNEKSYLSLQNLNKLG